MHQRGGMSPWVTDNNGDTPRRLREGAVFVWAGLPRAYDDCPPRQIAGVRPPVMITAVSLRQADDVDVMDADVFYEEVEMTHPLGATNIELCYTETATPLLPRPRSRRPTCEGLRCGGLRLSCAR